MENDEYKRHAQAITDLFMDYAQEHGVSPSELTVIIKVLGNVMQDALLTPAMPGNVGEEPQ